MTTSDDSRPITFIVPGQPVEGGVDLPAGGWAQAGAARGAARAAGGEGRWLPGRVKASVRLATQRAGGTPQRLTAVPGEDIVALHIANGPVLLLHPANARDLMLAQSAAASGAAGLRGAPAGPPAGEVEVIAYLRWRGLEHASPLTRGLGDVLLGAFEVLTGLGKDKVVDFAASQVVQRVDAQVEAGLYALRPGLLDKLKGSGQRVASLDAATAAAGPLLVFIHGTFSETAGTFGKLWKLHPQHVRRLFDHYGGRVFALEHETLGKSPLANALDLVRALPVGSRLHLVTHSRGGLVGEVLAVMAHQRAVSAAESALFAGAGFAAHRADLQALAREMARRRIVVERIVRVACPARGTLLASKRLDAYLSVLKWAADWAGGPLAGTFVDLLAEVARRRARPDEIPGLAAMIPDTPLLDWLNGARAEIAGELLVVAGDLEGDSVGSWVKTLLADAFYWTDSDLVVQTRSMYAGAPRAGGARFVLDQGGRTTHFAYFANRPTVDAIVDALVQAKPPEGFRTIGPLSWAGKEAAGLRAAREARRGRDPGKPAVFVLPGILGSNLRQGEDRIWLGLRLIGGLDRLAYKPNGADGVLPDGAVGLVYDRLIEHLEATHEVIEFAFDWRRPIEEEAARLAQAVDGALDARQATGQPVRLLAHSMGGIVARTMQLEAPATWDRLMAHAGARLVMLGTPNGGSYAPMQVLSGDDTFGNVLAAFGSPMRDAKARQLMAEMPGFMQLQAGLLDPALGLDREATWRKLADDDLARTREASWWHRYAGEAMEAADRWGVPPQQVLDRAVALRRRLDKQRDEDLARWADRLAVVLGRAEATPVAFQTTQDKGFVYLDAGDGDGRAPRASALLPGVKAWEVDAEHGSLPSEKSAFDAYLELLQSGGTQKLRAVAALRGGAGAQAPADLRASRPGRLRQAARPAESMPSVFRMGGGRGAAAPAVPSGGIQLSVGVLNGNLSFVAEPLLVGHYVSRELTGTEAVIDRLVGGTMSAALQAGIYPEDPGRHAVFVNTRPDPLNPWRPPRPRSAIVVGLGEEGQLREADLQHAVRQAVIAWAQRVAEDAEHPAVATELAATLMGSGGMGISPAGSARAIARGVREANLALAGIGWPLVGRLTLVELYLDRASEAWQGLQVLADARPQQYAVDPVINFGTGPLRRQLDAGYRGVGYELVTVTSGGREGALEFVLDSRRARSEVRAQQTQVALVRDMVRRAATADSDDPAIGRTLFKLLVPPEIEPFLAGTETMQLDLDLGAAALPWELLDDRDADGGTADGGERLPWAIRARLLRRLRVEQPRSVGRDASVRDAVLVIGEPKVDLERYAPLPAARAEAEAVRDALAAGGIARQQLLSLIGSDSESLDARAVIGALFERDWRIVHICGHGEMPEEKKHGGGVVLSEGLFLGPDEIRNLRVVPELVFLNCCHLAAFRGDTALRRLPDPGAFAANVAGELIRIGVRCVVACGWAVEDEPAAEFARCFYRELLRGARFIDAVAAAREACLQAGPAGKSWAAYQCYGDPNWVFRRDMADAQRPSAARGREADEFALIASPVGLALALESLAVASRYMGARAETQQAALRELEGRYGERWGTIGAVAEAFGVAWEAAGDRAAAVEWLQRAVKARDASASLKSEETLQNLRARDAARRAGQPLAQARQQVTQALAELTALAKRNPTVERYSLLGSAHKRRALIERDAGDAGAERQALQACYEAYREAEALARQAEPDELFYPALNRMALELVLHAGDASWPGLDAQASAAALASAETRARVAPDFWGRVSLIDYELYQALARRQLGAQHAALAQAYGQLHDRVASTAHWSSVLDQARLVLPVFGSHGSRADRAAAQALLAQLERYVTG